MRKQRSPSKPTTSAVTTAPVTTGWAVAAAAVTTGRPIAAGRAVATIAIVTARALAALAATPLMAEQARAASSLVAATFPNAWEDAYRRVITPLLAAQGTELVVAPALAPDPLGKQHDQLKSGWIPFTPGTREAFIPPRRSQAGRPVFDTVPPRFKAPAVPILDETRPYRPKALERHPDYGHLYP